MQMELNVEKIVHGPNYFRIYTNLLSSMRDFLELLIGIGIGIYLGCFLPGGNSANNAIIMNKSRHSHQKMTHSKKEMDVVYS